MIYNPVIECLTGRKSIRSYTDRIPTDEEVETVVRAGQQAPFAMQMGSLILNRDPENNPFKAPLLFTVCADVHRMELVMARRGWKRASSDIAILLFAVQDAAYMAQNMVVAAESLGMASCYLGAAPFKAADIREEYGLPDKVFPLVQLATGFPAEDPPVRPRYPLEFHLFKDSYPELTEEQVDSAMRTMDEGYLEQDYYRRAGYMIPLDEGMKERYDWDSYSWTEHISRKLGLWNEDPEDLLGQLRACGFDITRN